jgi:hypothetical protein
MNKVIFGILLLFVTKLALGQEYVFRVLVSKGVNQIKSGKTWRPIKTGENLVLSDEIQLSSNSYLGLVSSSGKPIELREPLTYRVSDLVGIPDTSTSLEKKYIDFILSSNSANLKKNRMVAVGAVSRNLDEISVTIPTNEFNEIYGQHFIVAWESKRVKGPYRIIVKNLFDEILFESNTHQSFIEIDRRDPKLANEESLVIEVQAIGQVKATSKEYIIKSVSDATKDRVERLLLGMGKEASFEKAINKILLAAIFEENKLYIDALTAYQQAIKLSPDIPAYQEAYQDFLIRSNLTN